jgi:RRXRR protein
MLVYVLNQREKPLMPCAPPKARALLKQGKAKVVRREPFTIKLLHGWPAAPSPQGALPWRLGTSRQPEKSSA